jgi:hypothetical protein
MFQINKKTIIIALFVIAGIFITWIILSGITEVKYVYPIYYKDATVRSTSNVGVVFSPLIRDKDNIPEQTKILKVTAIKVDVQKFVDIEGFDTRYEEKLIPGAISWTSKDGSKVLSLKNSEYEKRIIFYNGNGSNYYKEECTAQLPSVVSDLYSALKNDLKVSVENITDGCNITIDYVLQSLSVLDRKYLSLCTLQVNKGKLKRFDCASEYFVPNREHVINSLEVLPSLQSVVNNDVNYGFTAKYDIVCAGEGCPELPDVVNLPLATNIKLKDTKAVYVPVVQKDTTYLIPHHLIISEGTVNTVTQSRKPASVPVTYQIIIPAIQFRYFTN